jgi:hypothetical protein
MGLVLTPLTSLDTEVRNGTSMNLSHRNKVQEKKYIVKRGNKVHKTTKKYLNLGISQTDFFLKGEITDSNHSVSQNKRVCWAQSKLFAHCKHV